MIVAAPVRHPAGAPTGGQFAPTGRREACTQLGTFPRDTDRIEATARDAFTRLLDADPARALQLWSAMQAQVASARYPELIVTTGPDGTVQLADPYTGELTALVSEAVAFQFTRAETPDPTSPAAVRFDYEGFADFEGLVYRSSATDLPVSLPAGWVEV